MSELHIYLCIHTDLLPFDFVNIFECIRSNTINQFMSQHLKPGIKTLKIVLRAARSPAAPTAD